MSQSNELSHRIGLLINTRSRAEVCKQSGVSRETMRKIERGITVRFSSIEKIANVLNVDQEQRAGLLIAWVKSLIGPKYAKQLNISYLGAKGVSDRADDAEQIASLARQLDSGDRLQIIKAMTRPEVRRALPAINHLYDNVRPKGH